MLTTIVGRAVQLSRTDAGAIYVFDEARQEFRLRATYGMSEDMIVAITDRRIGTSDAHIGPAATERRPIQVPDIQNEPPSPVNDINLQAGYRAVLIIPLLRPDNIVGALVVRRKSPGEFPQSTIDLLETFAEQSVVAIQNARLFSEIEEKSQQLAVASQHKSQFLANMSHELRTPLNAILGYTELILDGIYGETPEKAQAVLKRVESNGRHLLGLINDVLDLSKIEAGQLTLTLTDYSMKDVLYNVFSAVEPLANGQEARLQGRGAARHAEGPRRRAAAHAGAAQPRRQRDQIHRCRRGDHQGERHQRLVHGRRAGQRPRHLRRPTRARSSRNSSRPTIPPPRRRVAPA